MSLDLSGSFMEDLKYPGVCFLVGGFAMVATAWFFQGLLVFLVGFGLILFNDRLRVGLASVAFAMQTGGSSPGDTDAMAREIAKMSQEKNYVPPKKDELIVDVQSEKIVNAQGEKFEPSLACCYDCYTAECDYLTCSCSCHKGVKK